MERARPSRLPLKQGRNVRVERAREKGGKGSNRRESDRGSADAGPSSGGGDRKEILALVLFALAAVIALSLFSYDAAAGSNLVGPVGRFIARTLFGAFGLGAFVVPFALALGFVAAVRPRGRSVGLVPALCYGTLLLGAAMLLDLVAPDFRAFGARAGGAVGGALADRMVSGFSTVGSVVIVSSICTAALVISTGLKVSTIAMFLGETGKKLAIWVAAFVKTQVEQHRAERAERLAEEEADRQAALEAGDEEPEDDGLALDEETLAEAALAASAELPAPLEEPKKGNKKTKKAPEPLLEAGLDARVPTLAAPPPEILVPEAGKRKKKEPPAPPAEAITPGIESVAAPFVAESAPPEPAPDAGGLPPDPAWMTAPGPLPVPGKRRAEEPKTEALPEPKIEEPPAELPGPAALGEVAQAENLPPAAVQALVKAGKLPASVLPEIDVPKAPPKPKNPEDAFALVSDGGFSLPPLKLLGGPENDTRAPIDEVLLQATAQRLRQKLAEFGIEGTVQKIRPGPIVTMYEFLPAAGVKISKIASLADDLAMGLEAMQVRIVAPIPGRGVVGFEVPNKTRETVYLRDVLEQEVFSKSASRLTMAIGKDIEGMPFAADLSKMPHLLIAGTTGSGKSVAINSMIVSMLYKSTPEELRFIMVDPKMVELRPYDGIPHLLLPVVTDPKKAVYAMRWAVDEMERRYQLLSDSAVRNIADYNVWVTEQAERRARGEEPKAEAAPQVARKILIIDVEKGETEEEAVARLEASEGVPPPPTAAELSAAGERVAPPAPKLPTKLPYVVIVIDEFADLMMAGGKEAETFIARIAQKARAVGIHLMLATQRPSVDVVTGVIKANFPSRVALQLKSRVDSQTIIDQPGAERLLGQGDMLIVPPTSAHPVRVHAAFVSTKEIERVVEHLKKQGKPVYDESILRAPEEDAEEEGLPGEEKLDPLYDQAVSVVATMRTVSVSILQRKLGIGYNRSANMVERMEREGIVGPANGSKPRDSLIFGQIPGESSMPT